MDKIRYRLVYNRKKKLNKQGTALVQVEALLNQRKIYFKTNIYLRPEHWDKRAAQVYNHPQANDLNAMLYEFILHLQAIEISFWKRGIQATLSLLKDAMKKNRPVNVTFPVFARNYVLDSDRRDSTKENLLTTITVLQDFRPGLDFKDITYMFLKDFEVYLREKGNGINTVAKHLRQLRTLVNEAINQGFNGDIQFHTVQTKHHEDCCIFRVYNSGMTAETDTRKHMEFVKGFDYHCAHTFYAIGEMVRGIFEDEGEKLCGQVLGDFENEYGKEMADVIRSYEEVNFNICLEPEIKSLEE